MSNLNQKLSTIPSQKNNILDFKEQRPGWVNEFNVTPGPGTYRQFSDFGFMDFKDKFRPGHSFNPSLTMDASASKISRKLS
jgi:hypothetical protein